MTIEQLRTYHQARPFKPFVLRIADGREYPVRHPENLAFSGAGRTIVVANPTVDTLDVIDLLLVTSIHVGNGQSKAGRGRKKK